MPNKAVKVNNTSHKKITYFYSCLAVPAWASRYTNTAMQALPIEWEISPSDNTADVQQLYKEVRVHFDVIVQATYKMDVIAD